jgi:integrase
LHTYAEKWLDAARGNLKASMVYFYSTNLEQHIYPALGPRRVWALRRSDCRELVTVCRGKGLKVGTVRSVVRTLSTILTQAVENELLPANPALRMGKYLRQADEAEPEIEPLRRAEASHLVAIARERFPQWYPFVRCGLRTGMRMGKLLALEWGDLDWRSSSGIGIRRSRSGSARTGCGTRRRGKVSIDSPTRDQTWPRRGQTRSP